MLQILPSDLATLSAGSRGLWIGLFVDRVGIARHPLATMMPDDAHVTFVHLGRTENPNLVAAAVEAAVVVAEQWPTWPAPAELTGCGRFYRWKGDDTIVGLVNGRALLDMRNRLEVELRERGAWADDRYGFIPHVTLDESISSVDGIPAKPIKMPFATLHVVRGDHRFDARTGAFERYRQPEQKAF